MRKKSTAALLAFFLGNLGAHKFYLNRTGMGVLYLFTIGFLGIGSLVNFIQLLVMDQAKFDEKYNNIPGIPATNNMHNPGNVPAGISQNG